MFKANFSACDYGIECFKKGTEYQGIKELAIENDNLIKRIAKLEAQIEKLYANHCGNCNRNILNTRLKKENAELKLKLEALDGQTPWKHIKDKSEVIGQLAKAKEIIKIFLGFAEAFGYSPSMDKFVTEAEQFIKESE